MLKKYTIAILFFLSCSLSAFSGELPSQGYTSTVVSASYGGPGSEGPDDPAPIGGGLVLLVGMSAIYFAKKKLNKAE